MKPKRLLALLAVVAVFGCSRTLQEEEATPSRPSSCKPTPPFSLTAKLSADATLLTTRFSSTEKGDLLLRVKLPEGITRTQGDLLQNRQVDRNEPVVLPLKFSENGKGRKEILVTATLTRGTARFSKTISVVLNEDGSKPVQRGELKKNSRGESILEFRVQ